MRFTPSFCFVLLLLVAAACGGGGGGVPFDPVADPVLTASCVNGTSVIMETDEQAYLQFGGAFDQLRHDEGPGNAPIKMTTKIDHFVKQYMCENDIAGLGLGIVWQGNLVYVKGYGLARGYSTPGVGDDVPVRGQRTRFRWASVSKCLTGVASVIATQETDAQGEPYLDLDADLATNYRCLTEYCLYDLPTTYFQGWVDGMEEGDWPLTELPIPARGDYPITPRRLLANRAGVQHYSDSDPALPGGTPSEGDKMANPGFLWALSYWTDNPLVLLPGTGWNYSSFGFNMAGAALDVAVPGQYFDWVRTRIAEMTVPSEMLFLHPDDVYDPTYDGAPWFTTANRAYGYAKTEEGVIVQNQTPGDVSYKVPSGGFISTTADMALFAEGLLNNRFLDQAGMDEVLTPQANRVLGIEPPPTSGYALGFSIGQRSGERFVAHNGGQQDAASRLCFFPDGEDPSVGKLAIVVMSNTRYLNRNAITNGVEALLRNPYVDLQGPIVFNGNEPRNPDWAADDLASRDAMENGPFANDGTYAQPDLDRYRAPVFRVDTSHRYDPNYEWDAPVESPDEVGEDDEPGVPGVIVLPNPR